MQLSVWMFFHLRKIYFLQIDDAKRNARKRVAEKLLSIEKDILRKSLMAVEELIGQLPNSAIAPCLSEYAPLLK